MKLARSLRLSTSSLYLSRSNSLVVDAVILAGLAGGPLRNMVLKIILNLTAKIIYFYPND